VIALHRVVDEAEAEAIGTAPERAPQRREAAARPQVPHTLAHSPRDHDGKTRLQSRTPDMTQPLFLVHARTAGALPRATPRRELEALLPRAHLLIGHCFTSERPRQARKSQTSTPTLHFKRPRGRAPRSFCGQLAPTRSHRRAVGATCPQKRPRVLTNPSPIKISDHRPRAGGIYSAVRPHCQGAVRETHGRSRRATTVEDRRLRDQAQVARGAPSLSRW